MFLYRSCTKFTEKNIMATITLDYDAKNVQVRKTLEYILSMGFFVEKKKQVSKNLLKILKKVEFIE